MTFWITSTNFSYLFCSLTKFVANYKISFNCQCYVMQVHLRIMTCWENAQMLVELKNFNFIVLFILLFYILVVVQTFYSSLLATRTQNLIIKTNYFFNVLYCFCFCTFQLINISYDIFEFVNESKLPVLILYILFI